MSHKLNPNIEMLELTVAYLGELVEKIVFVGGCTTGLLISDITAPPIRITQDVDAITDVDLIGYYKLQDILRSKGFREDQSDDAPICRWRKDKVKLDLMPTDPRVLGFSSDWFKAALETAELITLPSGKKISMITGPYFLACKFAAFESRGDEDYLLSHDMEDIVTLLDGRPELIEEVRKADKKLRSHLKKRFDQLLKNDRFIEALPGLLPGDNASQARVPIIISRIEAIIE